MLVPEEELSLHSVRVARRLKTEENEGTVGGNLRLFRSDRHAITVELVVLIITALACAEISEVMHEFDRCDPLDHLETQLIFASQPQRSAMQYADGRAVHLVGEDRQWRMFSILWTS